MIVAVLHVVRSRSLHIFDLGGTHCAVHHVALSRMNLRGDNLEAIFFTVIQGRSLHNVLIEPLGAKSVDENGTQASCNADSKHGGR